MCRRFSDRIQGRSPAAGIRSPIRVSEPGGGEPVVAIRNIPHRRKGTRTSARRPARPGSERESPDTETAVPSESETEAGPGSLPGPPGPAVRTTARWDRRDSRRLLGAARGPMT